MGVKDTMKIREAIDLNITIEELENRLEAASCYEIDPCYAQYCWQFATGYTCDSECLVLCEPFNGCDPYCI